MSYVWDSRHMTEARRRRVSQLGQVHQDRVVQGEQQHDPELIE